MTVKILHFADAHIDMNNFGRRDPETGFPVRVLDFLYSLDQIVDAALRESVDLVIFAGDAYKNRNPRPTFQKAWGERIMRLSRAGIPTVLLVGNHDVSPAAGRAHTMQEFTTLDVPHVLVMDQIDTLRLEEIPLQVIGIPWTSYDIGTVEELVAIELQWLNPDEPAILVAHAGVVGAEYGSGQIITGENDLVLSMKTVADTRLDYVALGHIHKYQSLNGDAHPPIVYSGSIERVDFGEIKEKKGYVIAEVDKGQTFMRFVELNTRPFLNISVHITSAGTVMDEIMQKLPDPDVVAGVICRVQLYYSRDWEALVDERAIIDHFEQAFSLQIQKIRQASKRIRLSTAKVESLNASELLEQYWMSVDMDKEEIGVMQSLANEVLFHEVA
jgi:exonuclease SbcD